MAKLRRPAMTGKAAIAVLALLLDLSPDAARAAQIQIDVGASPGSLVVTNTGPDITLAPAIGVERLDGAAWTPLPVSNLLLRSSCVLARTTAPLRLAHEQSLTPLPWTGGFCSSQCTEACHAEGFAPSGFYRFVIATTGQHQRFVSDRFEWSANPGSGGHP
jgi:hypothetical protein